MKRPIISQKPIRVISVLLLLFALGVSATAQKGRWEYLGHARVDGNSDHDKIHVDNGGTFRAIQLEVRFAGIEFNRVVVHFENGADHDIPVRYKIPAGGRTKAIDLPGANRRIKSVELWYEKAHYASQKPTLNLYGLR